MNTGKKMEDMLNDQTTYQQLNKDLTSKHQTRANKIVISLEKANILDKRKQHISKNLLCGSTQNIRPQKNSQAGMYFETSI